MSRASTLHFTAGTRAVFALALAHAGCAHGTEGDALVTGLDASVRRADGSATAASGGSPGEGGSTGSSMPILGGAAGEGGAAGNAIADDAEATGVGGGGGAGDPMDAAPNATPDAKDAARAADAAPDTGCPNPTACALRAALIHRYMFDGTGATATDSIGTAHGTIMNTTLTGTGSLALAGGVTDQYVDLPNGIVKTLTNATFEVWLTWSGGGNWQRIFDFGNPDTNVEGAQSVGASTLHMTPLADGAHVLRFAFKRADQTVAQETDLEATMPLASGVVVHVAGVIDDTNNMIYLYRDGAAQGSKAFADSLSLLTDINNWLGRSQYAGDPELGAALHEFRIYNAALSAAQIQASFVAGQNPAYLAK
jgi:Concanavalin A-like lectin/glucanases superfamily